MKKKILVFGASGFIAGYLIDALISAGHDVTASDSNDAFREHYRNKGVEFIKINISRKDEFSRLESLFFDTVIHLAACQPANISARAYDSIEFVEVNVVGTLNILEFCRKTDSGRLIYACSHRNTEGLWELGRSITENDGIALNYKGEYSMFSISETAAQDCIKHYQAEYGLRGVIFRLPPVYGYGPHTEIFKEGQPIKTGFQVFIEKAKAGKRLEVWGNAEVGRDIIYVKDVVSAFVRCIELPDVVGLYNITSGVFLTLREQAETIAEVFWRGGDGPRLDFKPEIPNGIAPFLYDNSKAKRDLGWEPKFSFKDMLLDYEQEAEKGKYRYLIEKRAQMLR